ncbi:MAG: HNH endonuclease [Actinomycetota bacterium]|nr:HNH endonuclease [Actinomycetota bacterium]
MGQAAEAIETARRLSELPGVSAAAAPTSEARLLRSATTSSLGELRDECARTRAAADPDPEARRKVIHEGRFLRTHTDAEGAWHMHMRNNPEVGAEILASLAPIRDRLFRAARAADRHEPAEAHGADSLVELARGASSPGPARARSGAKVIARIDLPALRRGRAVAGEVCELVGCGPVAVSAIRDLIDTGDPFLAPVVTKGEEVVGVAHLGRRATAAQQTALEWLYPTCAAEGCASTTFLEIDHRVDWATSHVTVLDLLDRLCSHHHDLKTIDNWALVAGRGKRARPTT